LYSLANFYLNSNDPKLQFNATQQARKILSRERHPPIDIVIKAGAVPRCIEFLKDESNPELVFEAAWVLTNIASGSSAQTEIVVRAGSVEPFIELLRSQHAHIVEQSVWALGNIAVSLLEFITNCWLNAKKKLMMKNQGDGPIMRDLVISKGVVQPLVALAKTNSSVSNLFVIK
jgi:hypothetical protein